VRVGNVLFVTSKANANDMRQDPDLATGGSGGPGGQPWTYPQMEILLRQLELQRLLR
jgi:hypothetical protein